MTESDLLHAIRAALVATGQLLLWRVNSGVDLTRGVRYGMGVGCADLIGVLKPTGRVFACEIKTPTGRLSLDQKRWAAAVNSAGGYACVARSVDDALAHLINARTGGAP